MSMESKDDQLTINERSSGAMTDCEKQPPGDTEQETAPNALHTFPEGGRDAWLTLLGAVLAQFATFGYVNAFGAYQGWIGSTQVFFILSMGIITGRLFDQGHLHFLVLTGTFLFAVALFMLSLSHENQFYQVFLSHGLLGGIACGMVYLPSLGIVSHYFHQKRALAMGIVAAGASLGAIVYPIMLNELFHSSVGFHNGVRASAGMNVGILLVANFLMKTRLPPKKHGPPVRVADFARDSAYVLTNLGGFCSVAAMFFPIFFVQLFAVKLGINRTLAFYSTSIMNASSIVGRILPGLIAVRWGVYNVIIVVMACLVALYWSMLAVHDTPGVIIFAIFSGFLTGSCVSLYAPAIASLARDFNEIGARLGICFTFGGFAGLIGTPVAGALISSNYIWWRGIVFVGCMMTAGFLFFFIARNILVQRKGTQIV
ncbi:hypothetical protein HGRIS_012108 [Hohenbuehelia grisea]|uniref:Major facilitator superfamily (MFS) profile domain-containing protein n=1 Tax=Hohenbuehelia grisea TaxID=104357 RepID=A0ABR3IRB2_9AGAR